MAELSQDRTIEHGNPVDTIKQAQNEERAKLLQSERLQKTAEEMQQQWQRIKVTQEHEDANMHRHGAMLVRNTPGSP
eukprot:1235472-Amphidinium_carterae.1